MFFTVKKLYNIIRFSKISNINKLKYGLSFNCQDYNSIDQIVNVEGLNK